MCKSKRERDVGIICVIIYDDLALEAWTQRKREREREDKPANKLRSKHIKLLKGYMHDIGIFL